MGGAPVALFPRVIRAPVFGRAYSGAPTLLHADFYGNWRAKVQNIYRDVQSGAIRRKRRHLTGAWGQSGLAPISRTVSEGSI